MSEATVTSKTYDDPRDVLVKPVVSEKSYALLDENKYTFIVAPGSNKTQIKQAVEAVFSVKVTGVNTINRQGKRKRTKSGFGKRADTKRAIVTLAEATVSTSSAARPPSEAESSGIGRGLRNGYPQVQADDPRAVVAPASPTLSRSRGPRRRSRWSAPLHSKGGRNNTGRVTVRHQGGGHKRAYRVIDFRRHDKDGVPAKVAHIEYDPNRTARIALLHYADGEKRYIIAPRGLAQGDRVENGPAADIKPGNNLALRNIPVGTTSTPSSCGPAAARSSPAPRVLRAAAGEGGHHGPPSYAVG